MRRSGVGRHSGGYTGYSSSPYGAAPGPSHGYSGSPGVGGGGGGGYGGGGGGHIDYHRGGDNYHRHIPSDSHDWQAPSRGICQFCEAKDRHAEMLQDSIEQLRSENGRLREDLRTIESAKDREVADVQDDLRRESSRLHEIHTKLTERDRELQQLKETDHMKNEKLRDLSDQLEHSKKTSEAERRRFEEEMENLRRQHTRDMETMRKDIEARVENEHRNVLSRDEQVAKLRQELSALEAQLRATATELEAEKATAKATLETNRTELARKEELRAMFEKETNLKQERVEEAHKLARTLQVSLSEKEKEASKLKSDLEHVNGRLEETERSLKTATDMSTAERERAEKISREYREITEMLGTTESLSSSYMATRAVREKLADHSETLHKLTKVSQELDEEQSRCRSLEMEQEELRRERDGLHEQVKARDSDLTAVREDLINSTRELRSYMIANEHILSEKHHADDTIEDLNRQLEIARDRVQELEKAKIETARVENEAVKQWERERSNMEKQLQDLKVTMDSKHEYQLSQAEREVDHLSKELRDKNEWFDMCKELGRLLDIDVRATHPQSVNQLYRKVEGTLEDIQRLKEDHQIIKLELEAAQQRTSSLPPTTTPMTDIVPSSVLTTMSRSHGAASEMDYLKSELRRSSEAMVRAKKQYSDFKEAVAKALKFGSRANRVDTIAVLGRINQLMANAPVDSRFDSLLTSPHKLKTTGGKSGSKSGLKDAKDKLLEKVQKKLRSALETIEAQDMWISVLQAKIGDKEASQDLQTENQTLRETLNTVKQHLIHDSHASHTDIGSSSLYARKAPIL